MNNSKITVDQDNNVQFPTGKIPLDFLNKMLNGMPFELDYADADDRFQWFSDTPDRVFKRKPEQLGMKVADCHPAFVKKMVKKVFDDFHSGARKSFEFWIPLHRKFVYIQYFAMYDENDNYEGCFEFAGDIKKFQDLKGQKGLDFLKMMKK